MFSIVRNSSSNYNKMFSLTKLVFLLCCTVNIVRIKADIQRKTEAVDQLDENNWDRMLTGEWMVEFFAPWCPACKELEPTWAHLGEMKDKLGINVGKVDVTNSPGLSGRFMVTALPTIYHVKDGIFRQYKSPRDPQALVDFVKSKTWMKVEPISSWKSPTSTQMSIISQFFKMSQVLRAIHNQLMEDFGLPTWGSYLIFAVATILIGALLGLVIVCIVDFVYPPKPARSPKKQKEKDSNESADKKSSDDEEEEIINSINDDLEDEEEVTDSEKYQDNKKSTSAANSPNARKRKTRKAD
ncbi:thioredoxin-related transmembrane protein 1 [Chelonus insularis]|uniref:thioredoxin-related transmembrane protein 1 n=1 Tax=Chelonus insularis TaxID=460826 RepID=UPI00158BBDD7|nr:thioredoxin-related transmembrane protein 1-like [Chelonus insularis]